VGIWSLITATFFAWSATTAGLDGLPHLFESTQAQETSSPVTCHESEEPDSQNQQHAHDADCHECVCCNGLQLIPKSLPVVATASVVVIDLQAADRRVHFFDPAFVLLRPPISRSATT
jgi:hypothetical protein